MPFLLLFGVIAGVGAIIAATQKKSVPGGTPGGGSLQGPGPVPLPNFLPPPVVQTSASLRQGLHYFFVVRVTFDPNAALQDLISGHLPQGLTVTDVPTLLPGTNNVAFHGLWQGQDGTILGTLDNGVLQFVSATEALDLPNPIALPSGPPLEPLPPNVSPGLFGNPIAPPAPVSSFGPHVAGTLSQYHPHAGSAFRRGHPQVQVGATSSGYNHHDVTWTARNYPRAAGTKVGGYG